MKIRRKARKRARAKVKTVYKARPRRKARRTRRAAAVRRVHVMKPRRRVRRRSSSALGGSNVNKIKNIAMKGALAVGGAAIAVFVTNQVLSMLGAKVDAKNKKWLMVASALGLGLLINKLSFTKKYATELTIGAVSYGLIAALSTNTDIKKYFAMAGSESDELDQIISNLNVAGEINFLGAREVNGEDSELNLLGISEMLGNMEQNDYSEDYE